MDRDGKRWTIALVAILLVAFALRAIQLDRHPLWWDEGLSAYLSHHDPLTLLGEMRATNHADPPVYPLALSGWCALAGGTPFSLRLFSTFASILTVALTWAVGCRLAGRKTALLAALLVALAPMQVYYAREAKSYAFATACALLSTYAWGYKLGYAASDSPPRGRSIEWWVTYVLSTAAAISSHYYLSLLIVWQGLWVAGNTAQAVSREPPAYRKPLLRLGQWALAMGAVTLLLTPQAAFLFGTTVEGVVTASTDEPLPLSSYLGQMALAFGAGVGESGSVAIVAIVGSAILGIAGALRGCQRWFLASWIVVSLAAAYFVQAIYSFFFPRFLLYLGPALYLLAAQGIVTLRRWQRPQLSNTATTVLVIGMLCLWQPGLTHIYTMPADEAEDPRPVVAHLRAESEPGDTLMYIYIWQAGYALSYYPQNGLVFYRAHHTPETVAQELEAIAESTSRLWLLNYQIGPGDPNNLPGSWLGAEAYTVEDRWFGNHNLALYLSPNFTTAGVGPGERTALVDERIELRYPTIDAQLHPGDALALSLQWRALEPIDEGYKAFVHVAMPGVPPAAQSDGEPQNGLAPTSTWVVGQGVVDRRAILLPDDIPPGRYQVLAGLYRPSDGTRLPISGKGEDSILLGHVKVEP